MRFHILTLFPEVVRTYLGESILKIGQQKGLLEFHLVNYRDFTHDRHRSVDDAPYGGGPGMLLKPEPIFEAMESVEERFGETRKILLSPQGETFTQQRAEELSRSSRDLLLLCGRYEGFDERVRLGFSWEEISIGDYVLSGGELPALVMVEAISRLVPGVLGDPESARRDSFTHGLLEYPQYTRPKEYRGWSVPEILLSGHHAEIEAWRRSESERRTTERRSARREETPPDPTLDAPGDKANEKADRRKS